MSYYVVKGAKLKCSMGDSQSDLNVLSDKSVFIEGKEKANIMDNKPMVNIQPFGQCQSLANPTVSAATAANQGVLKTMPCIPNTTAPWMPGNTSVFVSGQPALMDDCKLMCMWAGMIEITDAGQTSVQTGAEKLEISEGNTIGFGKLMNIDFSF